MELKSVDAALLQKAVLAAAKGLEAKKEWINELNVFPVPDGDTGTNMTMTIMAAAREVAAIENPTMESIAKALSSGSLRGARGNSGVILKWRRETGSSGLSSLRGIVFIHSSKFALANNNPVCHCTKVQLQNGRSQTHVSQAC